MTDGIDTKTPAGRFFFHVMASLAQMERELILERTRAGLQAARRQGRVGGRKRQMNDSKIQAAKKLLASGQSRAATRGGAQLRRVGPHVVSLGACLFTDVMRGQKDQYRPQFALQFIGPKRWRRFSLDLDVQSLLRASNPQFAIMPILCVIGRVHQRIFHSNLRPMESQIIQEFRPRLDARHEQVVPGPRAGEET